MDELKSFIDNKSKDKNIFNDIKFNDVIDEYKEIYPFKITTPDIMIDNFIDNKYLINKDLYIYNRKPEKFNDPKIKFIKIKKNKIIGFNNKEEKNLKNKILYESDIYYNSINNIDYQKVFEINNNEYIEYSEYYNKVNEKYQNNLGHVSEDKLNINCKKGRKNKSPKKIIEVEEIQYKKVESNAKVNRKSLDYKLEILKQVLNNIKKVNLIYNIEIPINIFTNKNINFNFNYNNKNLLEYKSKKIKHYKESNKLYKYNISDVKKYLLSDKIVYKTNNVYIDNKIKFRNKFNIKIYNSIYYKNTYNLNKKYEFLILIFEDNLNQNIKYRLNKDKLNKIIKEDKINLFLKQRNNYEIEFKEYLIANFNFNKNTEDYSNIIIIDNIINKNSKINLKDLENFNNININNNLNLKEIDNNISKDKKELNIININKSINNKKINTENMIEPIIELTNKMKNIEINDLLLEFYSNYILNFETNKFININELELYRNKYYNYIFSNINKHYKYDIINDNIKLDEDIINKLLECKDNNYKEKLLGLGIIRIKLKPNSFKKKITIYNKYLIFKFIETDENNSIIINDRIYNKFKNKNIFIGFQNEIYSIYNYSKNKLKLILYYDYENFIYDYIIKNLEI